MPSQAEAFGNQRQCDQSVDLHLCITCLRCSFTVTSVVPNSAGDLLIAGDPRRSFASPHARAASTSHSGAAARSNSCAQLAPRGSFRSRDGPPLPARSVQGFGEEFHCSVLHRPHGHRDVAPAREENDRQSVGGSGQLLLQIQSAQPGKVHVEHQTARSVRLVRGQKFLRTAIRRWRRNRRIRAARTRSDGSTRHHRRCGRARAGSSRLRGDGEMECRAVIRSAVTQSRPPCRSTIARLTDRPMPRPPGFVL